MNFSAQAIRGLSLSAAPEAVDDVPRVRKELRQVNVSSEIIESWS
jgi:hypothetical protein